MGWGLKNLGTTAASCGSGEVDVAGGEGSTQLRQGTFTLRVTADGFQFQERQVVVGAGDVEPLSFVLEPTVLRVQHNVIQAEPIDVEVGEDTLDPVSDAALERVAQTILTSDIRTISNQGHTVHGHTVHGHTVHGHNDGAGDDAENLVLSQQRANAVTRRLVALGVPAERLTATGHREREPVVPGRSAAARAKNHRVEFILEGS